MVAGAEGSTELSGCMDITVGTGMFMYLYVNQGEEYITCSMYMCIKATGTVLELEANFLSIFWIFLIYKS